jgi:hypothetical protein
MQAKQRNVVWPDTLRNGRSVDAFFWKGSPTAPFVQRLGAFLFGLGFLSLGAALLGSALEVKTGPKGLQAENVNRP